VRGKAQICASGRLFKMQEGCTEGVKRERENQAR